VCGPKQSVQTIATVSYWMIGVLLALAIGTFMILPIPREVAVTLTVVILLFCVGFVVQSSRSLSKKTSVTLYADHVEWLNRGKPGSCGNDELTLQFGDFTNRSRSGKEIKFGRQGGPYMVATRDFDDFGDLVSEIQRRRR